MSVHNIGKMIEAQRARERALRIRKQELLDQLAAGRKPAGTAQEWGELKAELEEALRKVETQLLVEQEYGD